MLVTWYKIGEMYFLFVCTSGFQVKEIERFTAGARVVVRTANMRISRRHLADYVKKLHKKRATRAARSFFFINQLNLSFVTLSLPLHAVDLS